MGKSRKGKSRNSREEKIFAETAEDLADTFDTTDNVSDVNSDSSPSPVYHFFWKDGTPFSQWHPSSYTFDGTSYVCAEQGMMHGKALLFDDHESARAIMETNSPRKMKALGQRVRWFKQRIWDKYKEEIVYQNSIAKFTQNEAFRVALLATTGTLVEASPSDKIWGIGLHERDARDIPESHWPGANLLGKILTRLRDEIRSGIHDDVIYVDEKNKEPAKETSKEHS